MRFGAASKTPSCSRPSISDFGSPLRWRRGLLAAVNPLFLPGGLCRRSRLPDGPARVRLGLAGHFSRLYLEDTLPFRFVFGASAIDGGLTPGDKETMLELFFTPNSVDAVVRTLCIDSSAADWGTGSDFVFADDLGRGLAPVVEWPSGGKCWYVRNPVGFAGDANADGFTDAGDAVYLINYIFKSGPAPDPLAAATPIAMTKSTLVMPSM